MKSSDTDFLALDGDILGGQHGSVRGAFVAIRLDLHATYQMMSAIKNGDTAKSKRSVDGRWKQTGTIGRRRGYIPAHGLMVYVGVEC